MTSSEKDSKSSDGRGLPVGVEWHPAGRQATALRRDLYVLAIANLDGTWSAVGNLKSETPAADGAAAQAAAEAALWRRDGFGVGEVRGVRVPFAFEGLDDRMTRELPGLSGRWTISKWRDAEGGGVDVDAVRAPAPIDKAARRSRPMPPVTPGAGRGDGDEEDEPVPCAKHDTTGSNIGWQSWCPGCNVSLRREPSPSREPSAPADGAELARLLPMLPSVIDEVRALPHGREAYLADAIKLLLDERERMTEELAQMTARASVADSLEINTRCALGGVPATAADPLPATTYTHDAAKQLRTRAEEAERKLAEVAALQTSTAADLDAARAQLRLVSAGPDDVWHWQGDGHDDSASLACPVVMSADTLREFVAARERVAELETTPPPGTVAALLVKVEEARANAAGWSRFAPDATRKAETDGRAKGLEAAHALITATLGAPTPLDRAVGEVCAVDVAEVADTFDAWAALGDICRAEADGLVEERAQFTKAARVALAGMLACDAASADDAKGGE